MQQYARYGNISVLYEISRMSDVRTDDEQITHAVLMLSIRHLTYVSIYVCCIKLIFYEFQNDL